MFRATESTFIIMLSKVKPEIMKTTSFQRKRAELLCEVVKIVVLESGERIAFHLPLNGAKSPRLG